MREINMPMIYIFCAASFYSELVVVVKEQVKELVGGEVDSRWDGLLCEMPRQDILLYEV